MNLAKMIRRGAVRTVCLRAAGWSLALFCALLSFSALGGEAKPDFEFFEKRVRPILAEHCYKCHSAASEKVKGGLLLDSKAGLLKGGETGPAIVPGDPEKSLLIKAVRHTDESLQMPPKSKLEDREVGDLVAWIQAGAPDPREGSAANAPSGMDWLAAKTNSWAYQKPREPAVPAVKNKSWPKSPIDYFVLSKLEAQGLSPAVAADKRTLIRRATFDLTGLPPDPDDVERFLEDNSDEAFARVVDRLLASPQYGERWARHWLDVVRYTDSNDARGIGGEADVPEAYRYRDWVVKSFNNDLPFDQFILQQFAGDILQPNDPEALNGDGIVATGMLAFGEWGLGDADKDKMMTDIVDDQIDLTGRAFLGLTLACARCHDHKFDPIPTEDYYALAGIFFSSHILPSPGAKTAGSAVLRIPLVPPAELGRRKARTDRMEALRQSIDQSLDEHYVALAKSILPQTSAYLQAAWAYHARPEKEFLKSAHAFAEERNLRPVALGQWINYLGLGDLALLTKPVTDLLGKKGLNAFQPASGPDNPTVTVNSTDSQIEYLTIKLPAKSLAVHPSPSAGVAAGWRSPLDGKVAIRGKIADADPNCGNGVEWSLDHRTPSGLREIAKGSLENGGSAAVGRGDKGAEPEVVEVHRGEMIQVAVYPKGDYSCDSTILQIEITELEGKKRVWNLAGDVAPDLLANGHGNPHADRHGNADTWSFYDLANQAGPKDLPEGSALARWFKAVEQAKTNATPASVVALASDQLQAALVALDAAGKREGPNKKLHEDFTAPRGAFWGAVRSVDDWFPPADRKQLADYAGELARLLDNPPPALPVAHGAQEGGVPESVHVGIRDARIHIRGRYDRLGPAVPRRFPRLLAGENQTPIAKGSGRLELAKWIGSPENPLTARVYVNRIWQHHFGEGIVRTPNNYGKLGQPPTHPELLDWLALRFVESGWSTKAMHRAVMLSAVYRQSSRPEKTTRLADPDNRLFGWMNRRRLEAEALRDNLLASAGQLDLAQGGKSTREIASKRRTLYLMTVRSDRNDYRSLFDAADPSAIVEKRVVSTVAPQALFLMNHPFALGQTKALAERASRGGEEKVSDDRKIEWLHRLLFGRPPTPRETAIGLRAVAGASGPESRAAAWEEYCQALVCSNEFLFVD